MRYYAKIIENKQDNCFEVSFPDVRGCYTCGDTLEITLEYAHEALACMLGFLQDEGEPFPIALEYEGPEYFPIVCTPDDLVGDTIIHTEK